MGLCHRVLYVIAIYVCSVAVAGAVVPMCSYDCSYRCI